MDRVFSPSSSDDGEILLNLCCLSPGVLREQICPALQVEQTSLPVWVTTPSICLPQASVYPKHLSIPGICLSQASIPGIYVEQANSSSLLLMQYLRWDVLNSSFWPTGSRVELDCLKCILRPVISLCAVGHSGVHANWNLAFVGTGHTAVFWFDVCIFLFDWHQDVVFCRAAHVTSADRRLWTPRLSAGTRTVRGSKGSSVGPACETATERTSVQLC